MEMDSEKKQLSSNNEINWDDDSGEIHTRTAVYHQTPEDGWQRNRGYHQHSGHKYRKRYIKGYAVGKTYVTDDFRKVIPGYIIATIAVIALCVAVTKIYLPMGIMFDIMGIAWIIGFWKNAPYKKWKNQSEKLKEKSENEM